MSIEAEKQDGDCQQCGGQGCVACDARKQQPKFWYDEEEGLLHDHMGDRPYGCIPLYTTSPAAPVHELEKGCHRSHPHENMDAMCKLRTEIARLTNENARLKAAAPVQELERLRDENERLHVENRRLIDRIETIGVPVGVGGFLTTTNAAQRQWVGLTDEEYEKAIRDNMLLQMNFAGIRDDIEAKLREKNGGQV